jgi:hypothetical protein
MSFKIGQPVIVYQRRKENPLKDKVFMGFVTHINSNHRKERKMIKVYRCNLLDLSEEEYDKAMKECDGVYYRKNFLLPYSPELYRNILEWFWQVRYLLVEKVYDFFPLTLKNDEGFLNKIKSLDAEQYRQEAINAVGFETTLLTPLQEKRGYNRLDYRKITKRNAYKKRILNRTNNKEFQNE